MTGKLSSQMNEITFVVPGQPVAKGRPRITTRNGFARAYTPAKTVNYETLVKLSAAQVMNGRLPIEGPLQATIELRMNIPASMSNKRQLLASSGHIRPITKPDCDNCVKALLDAINTIVYRDDAQVVELIVSKLYGFNPCAHVTIKSLMVDAA